MLSRVVFGFLTEGILGYSQKAASFNLNMGGFFIA